MMENWRKTGDRIHREWLDMKCAAQENFSKMDFSGLENSFLEAMLGHIRGDSKKLATYLRSDRPLTDQNREDLAKALEGGFAHIGKKRPGRPKVQDVASAAWTADWFYRWWRDENERVGVNDWGVRNHMRDEAIRIAIEVEGYDVDPERIRDRLERPKSRQK